MSNREISAVAPAVEPQPANTRLRLISFSTGDILARELGRAAAGHGLAVEIARGEFGVVLPELLSPAPEPADALLVMMDAQGFHSRDWRRTVEEARELLDERIRALVAALDAYTAGGSRAVLINTLPAAVYPQTGFLDAQHPDGAGYLVRRVNQHLCDLASRNAAVTLIDAEQAMADVAPVKRTDAKLWYYGRFAYTGEATRALAGGFAQALAARRAAPIKVLALDLDNTLWRGTFGEDGLAGLQAGDDFPGNAFKALQEECLRLKSQGVLLALLSKNDADVLRVFDEHPGMALRREDFVAHRINWQPKADNIRELAAELDLSLASFLFLDDSPHEREQMRKLASAVRVADLPEDPALRPGYLRRYAPLWPLRLTAEDQQRSAFYATQQKARALKETAGSLDEYLAGLDQSLVITPASAATLARIAQMHARTNQFNLTTRRLSEADLSGMLADPRRFSVIEGQARDKFGDHGIVICAIVEHAGTHAEIVSLLMSCRVIGRGIEQAFLGHILAIAGARGAQEVAASYIPTEKNGLVRDFYQRSGFELSREEAGGTTHWRWRKASCPMPGTPHVRVVADPTPPALLPA